MEDSGCSQSATSSGAKPVGEPDGSSAPAAAALDDLGDTAISVLIGAAPDDLAPAGARQTTQFNEETPPLEAQEEIPAAPQAVETSVIEQELATLSAAVNRFNDRSEAQEDIISRLHDKLQLLQAGETKQLLKPVISGLVSLHSELAVQGRSVTRELSVDEVVGLLDVFAVRVANILFSLGMEPFVPDIGEPFNGRFHQAIATVNTGAAVNDKRVASVLRPGFTDPMEKRIAYPAQVSVYRFDPTIQDSPAAREPVLGDRDESFDVQDHAFPPEGSPR